MATMSMSAAASSSKSSHKVSKKKSGAVIKRLRGELMKLMMAGNQTISAFPEGDNMMKWAAKITGPIGTVYAKQEYKLAFVFSEGYPFNSPKVTFVTPCFHPNVDQHGNICLDILKDKWSAAYTVETVLLSLQSLLGEPNNDSPLNQQAAELWDNQRSFKKLNDSKYAAAISTKSRKSKA